MITFIIILATIILIALICLFLLFTLLQKGIQDRYGEIDKYLFESDKNIEKDESTNSSSLAYKNRYDNRTASIHDSNVDGETDCQDISSDI